MKIGLRLASGMVGIALLLAGCGAEGETAAVTTEEAVEETAETTEVTVSEEYLRIAQALQDNEVTEADIAAAGGVWTRGDVESDRQLRFAKAAADLGNGNAALTVATTYHSLSVEGVSETESVELAMKWYETAGENGTPRGYANIGLIYLHEAVPGGGDSYGDVEYDESKAVEYFTLAAEGGDGKGARYLAECYANGVGVEASEEKAFEYYELGAEYNDSTAKMVCADYLLDGIGTEQNVDRAIALYQEIVDGEEHDMIECAYKLAEIYENGEYTDADEELAKEYYQFILDHSEEGNEFYDIAYAAITE